MELDNRCKFVRGGQKIQIAILVRLSFLAAIVSLCLIFLCFHYLRRSCLLISRQ